MEKEMSPPSKSQQKPEASYQKPSECATLEVNPPAPLKPSDGCIPSQHLQCNFLKDL